MKRKVSPEQFADELEKHLLGTEGKWDWDHITSITLADKRLERIRLVKALAESADVANRAMEQYSQQPPTIALNQQPDSATPFLITEPDDNWAYTIPREEYETEIDKEYPILPLKPGLGPTWTDDIMYGLAGDIVRKASEYCEAHPAGMYLDLLVSFGNLVGRGPYFNISSTQHRANEFLVRVGDSSVSRKGTGRDAINAILKIINPDWYRDRVMSGSGPATPFVKIGSGFVQKVVFGGFSSSGKQLYRQRCRDTSAARLFRRIPNRHRNPHRALIVYVKFREEMALRSCLTDEGATRGSVNNGFPQTTNSLVNGSV